MTTIGLIAGNGRFPFLVAEEIRKTGATIAAVALQEETDPALEKCVDTIVWLPLGKFQKMIDALHAAKAETAIMAGQVKHAQLFAGLSLDWRAIKLLGRLANKKTDTILGAVADEFAKEGITLLPSHQYLSHLLPRSGIVAGGHLSKEEKADVEFGRKIATEVARLDIGQTVCVKQRAVLAIESIEGTNECIRRAAKYAGEGVVVVKVAKPQQDFRFDIPVIGPDTVSVMKEVKARVIAIDAGATLMIDKDLLISSAKAAGISVVAQ